MISSNSDTRNEISNLLNLISGKKVKCSELASVNTSLLTDKIINCLDDLEDISFTKLSEAEEELILYINKLP